MHIRGSDRRAGQAAPSAYLPFAAAFVRAAGAAGRIYLATDSADYLREVRERWPADVARAVFAPPVLRSDDRRAVPALARAARGGIDRANTEVLLEILMLASSDLLLHAQSSVAEAAHYLNSDLHNASVDLEYREGRQFTPEGLAARVEQMLQARRGAEPRASLSV